MSSKGVSQQYVDSAIVAALPVINVKSYGATGDGVTDDTAAINSALAVAASLGRGQVFFPSGIFLTRGGHAITTPMTIAGAGRGTTGVGNGISVLSLAAGANQSMFSIQSKNVILRSFGLQGNKTSQTGTSHGIALDNTKALSYITLDDLWIDSFLTNGMILQTSGTSLSETVVSRCEVRNNGFRGIETVTGANDVTIMNCQVAQNQRSGIYMGAAGKVNICHSWGNGQADVNADYSGLTIIGGGVLVTGGQFESNGLLGTGHGRGIDIRGFGNTIASAAVYNNVGNGIYAFRSSAFTAALAIIGNQVYNNSSGGAGGGSGIVLDTLVGASVLGNHCYDAQGTKTQVNGILEVGGADYISYASNVSRTVDNKTAGYAASTGTHLNGVANNIFN
jgi:hypothetical protein